MAVDEVEEVAALISARDAIDDRIAGIIKRPAVSGHLGEWLAARIFGIELEPSATAAAVDGRFTSGPLAAKTVNIKWYLKREGLLDLTEADTLDSWSWLVRRPRPPVPATPHARGASMPSTSSMHRGC
jgi:hypothetical protein